MKKNNYIRFLTFIIAYIIVHIIYKLTGLNYNFSDGLNIKMLIDVGLWVTIYVTINTIINRVLLSNKK